jgi:5-methylcytosine-specific restriction protein A
METKSRKPNWTRDETILALDLYFQIKDRIFSSKDLPIIELSHFLNNLNI